jgi:DNA sulfur modification protein DndE
MTSYANIDFSSMCEIAFLLDIKYKLNFKAINKFLGFGDKEGQKVARKLETITKGQAISNVKEYPSAELFELNQYWHNLSLK